MCYFHIKQKTELLNSKKRQKIINWALECIRIEAFCYPCFGLVSAKDTGCHKDMNFQTLLLSQKTFRLYFEEIIDLIMQEPELKFESLKTIGLKQEQRMLRATNNINTHKGLVFAFGIIFYIALYGSCYNKPFHQWCTLIQKLVQSLKKNFQQFSFKTSGERFFQRYGILGARGTALTGYQVVFFQGLPFLKKYRQQYPDLTPNKKCLLLLIFYLHIIDDTVLINKIGYKKSQKIKQKAKIWLNLLKKKGWEEFYKQILENNDYYKKLKVSPGGCADLCIVTLFLEAFD